MELRSPTAETTVCLSFTSFVKLSKENFITEGCMCDLRPTRTKDKSPQFLETTRKKNFNKMCY